MFQSCVVPERISFASSSWFFPGCNSEFGEVTSGPPPTISFWIRDASLVLSLQRTEPVLNPPAREHGAVPDCALPLEVEFRSPPPGHAVFQLQVRRDVGLLPVAGNPRSCEDLEFQVPRLLQVMIVGDEVRALLGTQERGCSQDQQNSDGQSQE